MKKIEINKDNYQGYIELYKINQEINRDSQALFKKLMIKALLVVGVYMAVVFLTTLCIPTNILINVINIEALVTIFTEIGISVSYSIKIVDVSKKKLNNIKEVYPDIDIKILESELIKLLEEAEMLMDENKNNHLVEKLDLKHYESSTIDTSYIKADETKIKKLIR